MPELTLLERSILKNGWLAPITITPDGEVIDGFHRWRLCLDSKPIRERYEGKVPCVVLDVPPHRRKATMIRMNRARGTHMSVKMASLVQGLVNEDHMDPQDVARELGMTDSEVEILLQTGVFKARKLSEYRYARAWIPAEKETKR